MRLSGRRRGGSGRLCPRIRPTASHIFSSHYLFLSSAPYYYSLMITERPPRPCVRLGFTDPARYSAVPYSLRASRTTAIRPLPNNSLYIAFGKIPGRRIEQQPLAAHALPIQSFIHPSLAPLTLRLTRRGRGAKLRPATSPTSWVTLCSLLFVEKHTLRPRRRSLDRRCVHTLDFQRGVGRRVRAAGRCHVRRQKMRGEIMQVLRCSLISFHCRLLGTIGDAVMTGHDLSRPVNDVL